MPYKEKEITKQYYSIGEIAAQFGVSTSLIRFWEKEFDILKPRKNKKGDRSFTTTDLQNLKLIHHLVKEKGFTLKGAKKHLEANRESEGLRVEVSDTLHKLRSFLVAMRDKS